MKFWFNLLKNGPTPASFSFIFGLFRTNNTIFTINQCENMSKSPSSIQRQDSNPQPFEHELSPITTRPGLLPLIIEIYLVYSLYTLLISLSFIVCPHIMEIGSCELPTTKTGSRRVWMNLNWPGAYSIKLYGSVNYGFVVTAKFWL